MSAVVFESVTEKPEATPGQRAWQRLVGRKGAMVGLAFVAFFIVVALLAPWIAPHDPLATSWSAVRKAPSAAYLFGTDEIGRDVLSRVIWGARASLLAGVVSVCISLTLGVPIGILAGYAGGWTDGLISRFTDAMLACPFLILAIALAAFLGPRSKASSRPRGWTSERARPRRLRSASWRRSWSGGAPRPIRHMRKKRRLPERGRAKNRARRPIRCAA